MSESSPTGLPESHQTFFRDLKEAAKLNEQDPKYLADQEAEQRTHEEMEETYKKRQQRGEVSPTPSISALKEAAELQMAEEVRKEIEES